MIIAPSAAARSSGDKIGIKIGARQRGGGLGAFAGGRLADPMQELTNDHVHNRRYGTATVLTAAISLAEEA